MNKVHPEPTKKPIGVAQAREEVAGLVRSFATEIATGAIVAAKAGQLAQAKYLFELAGLFPATEAMATQRPEDSLTHTLLRRLGLPTEAATREDDAVGTASTSFAEEAMRRRAEDARSEGVQGAKPIDRDVRELKTGKDTVE